MRYAKTVVSVLLAVLLATLCACAAQNARQAEETKLSELESLGMMPLSYAELFSVERFAGGYSLITAGSDSARYLVVPEGKTVPTDLVEINVLQQPITRLYIASTSMVSLLDAIGALDCVSLVGTQRDGWALSNVTQAMDAGEIQFGGKFSKPDYELVTQLDIELHISNTMVDGKPEVAEKFAELGIPMLVENSSKEPHPLGRVEWVKLLGVILGREAEAETFFAAQESLLNAAASEPLGLTVAMGYLDGEKCYLRNGGDYCAKLISLAGGSYVCADIEPDKGGNTAVSFEECYARFRDADVLFYMNFTDKAYSVDELLAYNPLFADFKSVQNGAVWVTSPAFHQSSAQLAEIVSDMHEILSAEDPTEVTTTFLIKLD